MHSIQAKKKIISSWHGSITMNEFLNIGQDFIKSVTGKKKKKLIYLNGKNDSKLIKKKKKPAASI